MMDELTIAQAILEAADIVSWWIIVAAIIHGLLN